MCIYIFIKSLPLQALFGMLLFEEVTGLIWWTGTTLVVLGLAIIAKNAEAVSPKLNVDERKIKYKCI